MQCTVLYSETRTFAFFTFAHLYSGCHGNRVCMDFIYITNMPRQGLKKTNAPKLYAECITLKVRLCV